MRTKKRLAPGLFVGALAALTLPPFAFAGEPGAGPLGGHGGLAGMAAIEDFGPMADRTVEHLAERLELSAGQEDELRALFESHREENTEAWQQVRSGRQALHEAILSETLDEESVRAAVRQLAIPGEVLAVSHARLMSKVRSVLTPDQVEELKSLHAEHGHRAMSGWHKRHGGRGGHDGHRGHRGHGPSEGVDQPGE